MANDKPAMPTGRTNAGVTAGCFGAKYFAYAVGLITSSKRMLVTSARQIFDNFKIFPDQLWRIVKSVTLTANISIDLEHMAKFVTTHAVDWFGGDPTAGSVLATAQRLIDIEQTLANSLPKSLRQCFAAAQLMGSTLTLVVDNSAVGAKLRQLSPSLLKQLDLAGWRIAEIKIKVASQATRPQNKKAPKQAQCLGSGDLQHFETLATKLRPGPLSEAVQKLLRHHQQDL